MSVFSIQLNVVVLVLILHYCKGCSFQSAGKDALDSFGLSVEKASSTFGNSLQFVGKDFSQSVNNGVTGFNHTVTQLGGSAEKISQDLNLSIRNVSQQLSNSFDNGVTEVGKSVETLAATVMELANKVNINFESRDFANIGEVATKSLKDALIQLSKTWQLAVNTADLRDFGAEAARVLAKAIQNTNVKMTFYFGADDNVVKIFRYMSIAGGLLAVAILLTILFALTPCISILTGLCGSCIEGCSKCCSRTINYNYPSPGNESETKVLIRPTKNQGYGSTVYEEIRDTQPVGFSHASYHSINNENPYFVNPASSSQKMNV